MRRIPRGAAVLTAIVILLPVGRVLAGQGAQRLLYTLPNMKFVEQVSGETVININELAHILY